MNTLPYHAPQRPAPTPEAVLAYCSAGHTNADAAQHFGITDRYVRKLKSRARGEMSTVVDKVELTPIGAKAETGTMVPTAEPPPHYATVAPSAVARDGQLWKCPICGEMMAPLPGTTGAEWAEAGCYMHQAKPPITSSSAELHSGTANTQQAEQAEQDRTGEHEDPSPCLVVPARSMEQDAVLMGGTVPVEQVRPVVIRERVVYRERERVEVGLVGWVRDHPAAAHQAVAWLIAAGLIAVASLG